MPDTVARNHDPLGSELVTFEVRVAAEATQPTASGDHPVVGGQSGARRSHHAPHRSCGARVPGPIGNVPVRGHAARRDLTGRVEDARDEVRTGQNQIRMPAVVCRPPSVSENDCPSAIATSAVALE